MAAYPSEVAIQPYELEVTFHGPDQVYEFNNFEQDKGYLSRLKDSAYLSAIGLKNTFERTIEVADPLTERIENAARPIGAITSAAWREACHGENRIRANTDLACVGGAFAAGITKAPAFAVPAATLYVLEKTGQPELSVITAFSAQGLWVSLSSRIWSRGVESFPESVSIAGNAYPRLVGECADALPGLDTDRESSHEGSKLRRAGKLLMLHASRGVASYAPGVMPYMVTGGLQGQDKKERTKLSNALSIDAALVTGLSMVPASYAIAEAAESNPALAEKMQATLIGAFVTAGYAVAGTHWIKNKLQSRREAKSQ